MDLRLYFSRRHFFQTGFHASLEKTEHDDDASQDIDGHFKEIYHVSTTVRKRSTLPDKTTIEYVGAEDEDKNRIVATIEWRWPSQSAGIIEVDGKRHPLKEFMKREGLFRTGTHVKIGDERFTWRSAVCRPASLFDTQNRPVARLTPFTKDFQPLSHALVLQPGCLRLMPDIAPDPYARDFVVASFFVYRACRDLHILLTPWWKRRETDFNGMRLKPNSVPESWYSPPRLQ